MLIWEEFCKTQFDQNIHQTAPYVGVNVLEELMPLSPP